MALEIKRPLKVFLCHASGDKPRVRDLYKRLAIEGVDAWLDQEKLLPGQDWRSEIPRAVQESDVVVIFLSKKSTTKEGYVQKEIRFALDIAEEKPEGTIFLIPARLEDCVVPERLSRWQWVDLYEENGFIRLLRSLKLRADKVNATIEPVSYEDENKELERRLEQLYTEGLAAFYTEDWDRACHRFQSILSERPNHTRASEKLAEAEKQRDLAKLYAQASEMIRSEDWGTAIKTLEELTKKSSDYKDVAQLLKDARRQKQLKELYAESRALHAAQKWQAVVRVFEQIHIIDPNYPDPDDLLISAQKEASELQRLAALNDQYSHALRDMDSGNWFEARRLLEQVHKAQTGFLDTERLLRKVEDEVSKDEEKRRQNDQINTLYEQAHGLLRSKKWRNALDKLEQIRKLDDHFPDTDGIAEKAQKELAREEQEAERQDQLAALYAEAVKSLKEEKYQEALDTWQEVKAIDSKYPDRQWVQRTAKRKLAQTGQSAKKQKIKLSARLRNVILIAGLSGLILLGFIGTSFYINQAAILPHCSYAYTDPLLMKSMSSSSPVFVDGKITYPAEWADAGCHQINLVQWVPEQACAGEKNVSSNWYVKNDHQKLYILVSISKLRFTPEGTSLAYFYPYPYTDRWQHSDTMTFEDGGPVDQFGWDDEKWIDDTTDGGKMNTRAKSTQTDQYFWYEFSKPLDSGDGHDWDWKPGNKVGTDITGGLMIGSWGNLPAGAGDAFLCRNIQLLLSK
ncbi:MAG: TIR domain-containing protein [Anaerolineales bacterium]